MSTFDVAGDLRAAAKEQRREKEHRVKYRGVNAALLGQPVNWGLGGTIRGSTAWNATNKYRMRDMVTRPCHCTGCRRQTAKMLRRKCPPSDLADVVCTAPTIARKNQRPRLNDADSFDFRDSYYGEEDEPDASMAGVEYSFDNAGPTHEFDLSHAVTQAVEKFQAKELATLIKNEYEFIDESETDEEFELI